MGWRNGAKAAALTAVGLAVGVWSEAAKAQTLIMDGCYSDDFMAIVGDDQVFDLSVSLYATPSEAERLQYEEVLGYFADAVYEMSNGAHKVRNVEMYVGGRRKRFADVVWLRGNSQVEVNADPTDNIHTEGAVAHVGGILVDLGKLYFFDHLYDAANQAAGFLDLVRGTPNQQKQLGYALAHEFGHYAYSLADDYDRSGAAAIVSIMGQQYKAVHPTGPDNLEYLNFHTVNSLNYDQDTGQQYDRVSQTAWDYVASSCLYRQRGVSTGVLIPDDLQRIHTSDQAPRSVFYSRLQNVKPDANDTWQNPNDLITHTGVIADLYGNPSASDPREHLNVIWVDTGRVDIELVLDASGSMVGEPIARVIAAAQSFAQLAVLGRTSIGVTTFESVVNTAAVPLTFVQSDANIQHIQSLIGGIVVGDDTAMFAAANDAATKLEAYRTQTATNPVQAVFLLSDGNNNVGGATEEEVIAHYNTAGIRMHTVGYADRDASEAFFGPLERMAAATKGVFHRGLTQIDALSEAMRIAVGDSLTIQDIALADIGDCIGCSLMPLEIPFDRLTFDIVYAPYPGGDVSFSVIDPFGVEQPSTSRVTANADGTYSATLIVGVPALDAGGTGDWVLRPNHVGAGANILSRRVLAVPGDTPPIELIANSRKANYFYPEPVQIHARVVDTGDLAGVDVVAQITTPSGMPIDVELWDDGEGNDDKAGDGLYSGVWADYAEPGVHDVMVVARSTSETARIIPRSTNAAGYAVARTVPLGRQFARRQPLVFGVWGLKTDDHGNTPATATTIYPDGTSRHGKLEVGTDVDYFRVDGVDTSRPLSIRLYELGFDIAPEVKVFSQNGQTQLALGNTLRSATSHGGLSVYVPKQGLTSTVYFSVRDVHGIAGGTYSLDAGPTSPVVDAIAPPPYVSELPNGDVRYAISFPAKQQYVEVFVRQNGVQNVSGNIVQSERNNGDGTYTYERIVPASWYHAGDVIQARFYSYKPQTPGVFTPGPQEQVWFPDYLYGEGFQCPPAPINGCTSSKFSGLLATASSVQNSSLSASRAVDNNLSTRWSSAASNPQWLRVDLGQVKYVDRVTLNWENAASAHYQIQSSMDGTTWTSVYEDAHANGGFDNIDDLGFIARYVRMYSFSRTTQWGNSLWELSVYGDDEPSCTMEPPPEVSCP